MAASPSEVGVGGYNCTLAPFPSNGAITTSQFVAVFEPPVVVSTSHFEVLGYDNITATPHAGDAHMSAYTLEVNGGQDAPDVVEQLAIDAVRALLISTTELRANKRAWLTAQAASLDAL